MRRWAAANVAVPTEVRHFSAPALGIDTIRTISQVSRCPAYGGVPISVS
jgi:hypothetical protein